MSLDKCIERVKKERDELKEKLDTLNEFMGTKLFEGLHLNHRFLLSKQCDEMTAYLETLELRLDLFESDY